MSMLELINKGGPIVWILFAYSVVALSIVVERLLHFLLMPKPEKNVETVIENSTETEKTWKKGDF